MQGNCKDPYVILNADKTDMLARGDSVFGFDETTKAAEYAESIGLQPGDFHVVPLSEAQTILNATS